MQDLKAIHLLRPLRQIAQVSDILGFHGRLRPKGGLLGHRIEPFQIFQPGGGFIMITAHDGCNVVANPFGDGIRIGAIATRSPQQRMRSLLRPRMRQHRLQGFPVAVDVAENQVAHR